MMGLPDEAVLSLNADHHSMCKYESPTDPIYLTVKDTLKRLVEEIQLSGEAHIHYHYI
jgi:hypothetical protein